MEIYCTRPNCPAPINHIENLEIITQSITPTQRFCTACGMNLVLSGRYIPLSLLGSGAFGVTFLARDLRTLERKCIVKQLRPQTIFKPEQMSAVENLFKRESAVLEQLGDISTQIPTLFDSFVLLVNDPVSPAQQELFYLVQQYIDGQDLSAELKKRGAFSQGDILELMYQILPVLNLVHENGTIHRDVKPANIMRSRGGLMYLIDFGAVKQVMSGVPNQQSIVIGTEGYAPIEQMSGREVYPSTDLYALAISCITLLGNIKPNDPKFHDFIDNWRSQLSIDPHLADIFERMTLVSPAARYQSVSEVFAALATHQLFPPPTSRPTFFSGGSQPMSNFGSGFSLPESGEIAAATGFTRSLSETIAPPPTGDPPAQSVSVAPVPAEMYEAGTPIRTSFHETYDLIGAARRSALFGSGGLLVACGLISLLGTIWLSSGLWLLIFAGVIFYRYRNTPVAWQLFGAAIVANGLVFLMFSINRIGSLPNLGISGIGVLLLVALLTGILFFVTAVVSHLVYQALAK
jgi:serine/threonine protein kinase